MIETKVEELQCWNSFSIDCKVENCIGVRDRGVVTRIHKGSPTGSTNTFIWVKWDSDGSHNWISNGEGLCCISQQNEWQPIDSAPKDGKFFLCISEDGEMMILNEPKGYSKGSWSSDGKEWFGSCCSGYYNPTHWMPLPNPPASV